MRQLKHIGRVKNTGAKVVVVFRTLPGESNSALVVNVSNLTDAYHDALMKLLESDAGQDAWEFGEILHVRPFPDGRPMLRALQADGRLQKVATDLIVMMPTPASEVPLVDLNVLIAEQKNCSIDDLSGLINGSPEKTTDAVKKEPAAVINEPNVDPDVPAPLRAQASTTEALSDQDLARSYRSQADALYKEAASLRKQADELDPPKKKATAKTKTETVDA